jgi:glyoxylase-like metal-dependent hydrolase (beta-lactamase superfamily II)
VFTAQAEALAEYRGFEAANTEQKKRCEYDQSLKSTLFRCGRAMAMPSASATATTRPDISYTSWMADLPTRQIQIIRHIETHYGKGWFINHMVLTHADNDHATGLVSVLKHFSVKNLWMNRPWLYAAEVLHHFHGSYELSGLVEEIRERHGYLVELERLAAQQRDNGA